VRYVAAAMFRGWSPGGQPPRRHAAAWAVQGYASWKRWPRAAAPRACVLRATRAQRGPGVFGARCGADGKGSSGAGQGEPKPSRLRGRGTRRGAPAPSSQGRRQSEGCPRKVAAPRHGGCRPGDGALRHGARARPAGARSLPRAGHWERLGRGQGKAGLRELRCRWRRQQLVRGDREGGAWCRLPHRRVLGGEALDQLSKRCPRGQREVPSR
jgi:hypothetical protein